MEHWTTYLPQCAPHSPQWSTGPHTCHNVLPTLLNGALDHIPATMCSPLSSMEHWTTYLPQCAPHSPQCSTGPHTCHNVLPTLLNGALDHIPATMCSPLSSMEHWTTYLPQCAPHSPQWSTGPHTCHNVLPTLLNGALDHGIRLGQTLQPFHQFGEVTWVLGLHCYAHHRRHAELHGLEEREEREDQMIEGEGGSNDRGRGRIK